MSDESFDETENWSPTLEEYNPNITKEQWIEFVQNKNIFTKNALITFACIQKATIASCSDMAKEFGRTKNFYNVNNWNVGERIHEITNCPLSKRIEGENRFWSVCCLRRMHKNGTFEYKIRPELQAAFDEAKVLEGIEVMDIEKEFEKFKNLLEYFVTHLEFCENENKNTRGYEKYIKPWIDANEFKKSGIGQSENAIQKQIKPWEKYNEGIICIAVDARNYKAVTSYLQWESTWLNIRPKWENDNIAKLYLTSDKSSDAKSEMEKTIEELGLFNEEYQNFTPAFKDFYEKFMSYKRGPKMPNTNVTKYANLLKATHNIILHGAPGTGKTYLAKQIAAFMGAETGFVQFHPSYDYTDFVEGLRPIKNEEQNGQIGFERKDGVFKNFCKKALENFNDSKKSVKELQSEKSINEKLNDFFDDSIDSKAIFNLTNGNEFYIAENLTDKIIVKIPDNKQDSISVSKKDIYELIKQNLSLDKVKDVRLIHDAQTRQQSDSYVFVLYKKIKELKSAKLTETANKIDLRPFVFIIDEINRGDLSKIFGELFFCIDPSYRGTKGLIQTQYQNLVDESDPFYKGFYIPENVYIIGSMNDIDRSVETMDFAFRRRFTFVEIEASDTIEMLDEKTDKTGNKTGLPLEVAQKAKNRMTNLNKSISTINGFSSAYHIGGAYFLKLKDLDGDFEKLWEYHLKPLLCEYLRGIEDEKGPLDKLKTAYDKDEIDVNVTEEE